jgi:cytochrome c-type biogenesis protein CcmE
VNVSQRTKIIVGLVIVLPVLLHLVYALWASPQAGYYVTVGELYDTPSPTGEAEGQVGTIRVGGEVMAGSISWDTSRGGLGFVLTDGIRQLPVAYSGPAPDTFRAGATAIVEGKLGDEGRFLAHKLLLKCPHRYVTG